MDLVKAIKEGYPLEAAYLLVGGSDSGDLEIAKAFAEEDNVFTFDSSDRDLMMDALDSDVIASTRGGVMLHAFLNKIEKASKEGNKCSAIINYDELSDDMKFMLTSYIDGMNHKESDRNSLLLVRASADDVLDSYSPLTARCVVIHEDNKELETPEKTDGSGSIQR